MPSKKNIIVGAASVFIGPSGTNRPAAVLNTPYRTTMAPADGSTTGDGTVVTDWRDVGYTQDGLEVSTDPSFGEVEVDQLLDAAKIFKDGMGLSISTTFAEATLRNLVVAWGQQKSSYTDGVANADDTLHIESGALGDAPVEYGLVAIGNGVEQDTTNKYKERIYHAFRVLSVEGSSHSLARADATVIPVTFRALPSDTGRYATITDRVPNA